MREIIYIHWDAVVCIKAARKKAKVRNETKESVSHNTSSVTNLGSDPARNPM